MFDTILILFAAGYTPYYVYKSLKRGKLSHKLAGLTTSMIFVFLIIGTRPPINLNRMIALGLLGIGIALELLYLAYKEKNLFLYMIAGIVALFAAYMFVQRYCELAY